MIIGGSGLGFGCVGFESSSEIVGHFSVGVVLWSGDRSRSLRRVVVGPRRGSLGVLLLRSDGFFGWRKRLGAICGVVEQGQFPILIRLRSPLRANEWRTALIFSESLCPVSYPQPLSHLRRLAGKLRATG